MTGARVRLTLTRLRLGDSGRRRFCVRRPHFVVDAASAPPGAASRRDPYYVRDRPLLPRAACSARAVWRGGRTLASGVHGRRRVHSEGVRVSRVRCPSPEWSKDTPLDCGRLALERDTSFCATTQVVLHTRTQHTHRGAQQRSGAPALPTRRATRRAAPPPAPPPCERSE